MIMEAMRLSVIDHEEHQRKQVLPDPANPGGSGSTTPNSGEPSTSTSSFRRRAGTEGSAPHPGTSSIKEKATSKLFSKFGNRSRSGSSASQRVTFAPDTTSRRGSLAGLGMGGSGSGTGSGGSSTTHLPAGGSDFSPIPSSPLVSTISNSTPAEPSPTVSAPGSAVPRISLDMAPLTPDHFDVDGNARLARSSIDTSRTA